MAETHFHATSLLAPSGWLSDVTLTIRDGRIARIAPGRAPGAASLPGAVVPGLPNLHSHAFQRAMAGLTERAGAGDDSFWTWRETMYAFVRALDPEAIEAVAALAYTEMLEAGFTRVGEFHYLHHQPSGEPYADLAETSLRHVAAAESTGIGLTHLPVFYAHGGFGGAPAAVGQRPFLNTLDRFADLLERCRSHATRDGRLVVGLAPHSLRAASLAQLTELARMGAGGPIHIHVSEQVKEVEDCRATHGTTPIRLLADTVELGPTWCLIHATHATNEEIGLMARAGAVAGLCPVTEANLGDGIFPIGEFLARGGRFGVGTDSNVAISAREELRVLDYGQRLTTRRRVPLAPRGGSAGRALWEGAASGGSAALMPGRPAGLVEGAAADFVVLDPDDIAFVGRSGDALMDTLVFAQARRAIREVFVGGRRVVAEGRHVAREAVVARARSELARVMARL